MSEQLPPGWECRLDSNQAPYYINHNQRYSTYKDPRLAPPMPSPRPASRPASIQVSYVSTIRPTTQFSQIISRTRQVTQMADSISHTLISQKGYYKNKANFHTLKQRLSEILTAFEKIEVELNVSKKELLLDHDFRALLISMAKSVLHMIENIRRSKRNFLEYLGSTKICELCLTIQQKMDGIRANFDIKVNLEGSAELTGESGLTIQTAKDSVAEVSTLGSNPVYLQNKLDNVLNGSSDSTQYDSMQYDSLQNSGSGKLTRVRALYKYIATCDTELNFEENEELTVTDRDESGWWYAERDNGQAGFVPNNYLEIIEE